MTDKFVTPYLLLKPLEVAPDPPPLAVDARTLGKMLGLSVRTIRAMDSAGRLPKPLRFGHAVRWNVEEVKNWLAAGAPDRRTWDTLRRAER